MTISPAKRPRIQLEPEAYQELCRQVLQRDSWRCQHCGNRTNLQVHHITLRSRSGDDVIENLITLCLKCHVQVHTGP